MLKIRVFILGLDALDCKLVEKWRLTHLLQKRHGSFKVGSEYYDPYAEGTPYSPPIWVTIITGRKPEEHGVNRWWTYGRLLDKIRYMPVIRHIRGKRKLLWRLGLKPHVVNRKDVKVPTIFDVVKPSMAVNVLGYNFPTEYSRITAVALEKGGVKEYVRAIWRVYDSMVLDTFKALEENRKWRLFMTYFNIADLLGHVYNMNPLKMFKVYSRLNQLAKSLQEAVPEDTFFLIMSDRAMKAGKNGVGEHADYAFWSLNIETDWAPKDFTDFYPQILRWLNEDR